MPPEAPPSRRPGTLRAPSPTTLTHIHSLIPTSLFTVPLCQAQCGDSGSSTVPVCPRGACSPVRQADVKCTHSQLEVQAPMNAVRGGGGSLGVTSVARALIRPGNSGRAADSSHSSGFLPRLHRPSPPDSRPSPGWPSPGLSICPPGHSPAH